MKTVKIIGLICILTFLSMQSKTGTTEKETENIVTTAITPQELLKSKKWNIQGKSVNIYYEYTQTKKTLYVDGTNVGSTKYYISDTNCFEQSFDVSKVGQVNSGRFLVTEDSCFYITVINDSTVQISYLSQENPQTTTLIAME